MSYRRIAECLRSAAFVIRGGYWCQGALAKDHKGFQLSHHNHQACAWCADGAIYANRGHEEESKTFADVFCKRKHGVGLVKFNDTPGRTAKEVADLLDAAADEAERMAK